jgi:ribose 1,5-bisphosphokinase PhnN
MVGLFSWQTKHLQQRTQDKLQYHIDLGTKHVVNGSRLCQR